MDSDILEAGNISCGDMKFQDWGAWQPKSNDGVNWFDNFSNPLQLKLSGDSNITIWARLGFAISAIPNEVTLHDAAAIQKAIKDKKPGAEKMGLIEFDFTPKSTRDNTHIRGMAPNFGLDMSVGIFRNNPETAGTGADNMLGFAAILNAYNFKWQHEVDGAMKSLDHYVCAGAPQPLMPQRCMVVFSTKGEKPPEETGEFTFTILISGKGMGLRHGHSGQINGVDIRTEANNWEIDVDPRIRAIGTN